MLIYCPKCSAAYEINEELIKDKDRMVKCSHCNEIFDAGSLIEKSVDNLEDISEENAFNALAAMMRDADVFDSSEIFADRKFDDDDNEVNTNKLSEVSKTDEINDEAIVENNNDLIIDEYMPNPDEEKNVDNNTADEVKEEVVEESLPEENLGIEANQEDADDKIKKDNAKEEVIDIESIYNRLSEHTSHLIERENELPLFEKICFKVKDVLGFHFKIKWNYIIICVLIFTSLSLYNHRYDVVRRVPFMNSVYKAFGIKAKIAGEGLEFQNIAWEYVIENSVKKMEVKGFINNVSQNTVEVPIVHVEILDKDTTLLQSFNQEIKEKEISPTGRASLHVVVENPAPTAKYIYLTFIDKN